MKKIQKLSIIMLLMIIVLNVYVYAKPNCNVNMKTQKTEIDKNEEFTVEVEISNIQSERGIIAIEATLEYDKESITLVKMEGQNDWSTPIKDLSYNETNGKLVIDKRGLAKSDETILKLVFKTKEISKENVMIALKDITIADGTEPSTVANAYKNITIKAENENPTPKPPEENPGEKPGEPDDNNTNKIPDDTNNSNKPNKPNNSNNDNKAPGKIPQTGSDNIILMTSILVLVIMSIVLYIKNRNIL